MPPEVETHLVNAVLTNGARYYVDHAHPEYSTPECSNPLELVCHDRAGEVILGRSMEAARHLLPPGDDILIHKNNSDGKGNSYGCHENYLVDRAVPFSRIVQRDHPPPCHAADCTAAPARSARRPATPSSRHTSRSASEPTSSRRRSGSRRRSSDPIVNTRDEPHADPQKYRRLHVIVGRRQPRRSLHVPQGGHDRPRARHDRGRLPRRTGPEPRQPGRLHPGRVARSGSRPAPRAGFAASA